MRHEFQRAIVIEDWAEWTIVKVLKNTRITVIAN
jgi:hypothetical protein